MESTCDVTYFGYTKGTRMGRIEKLKSDLEHSRRDIRDGNTIPADEVFRKMEDEFGWPHDEEDKEQDRLRQAIHEAEHNYNQYCHRRERKSILESIMAQA